MTTTVDAEPACPEPVDDSTPGDLPVAEAVARRAGEPLIVRHIPVREIPAATWDALARRTPWATPFSRWAFHQAWWDAYGGGAHEETLAVFAGQDDRDPIAVVPLMHRHEVEPGDEAARTHMRHGTDGLTHVEPEARAVFFGASYHADYATVLADPDDLPAVSAALVAHLAARPREGSGRWDVVDLRRLRCGDPVADALFEAFGAQADVRGWQVTREREDVCPVVLLEPGVDVESYLDTLGKKERHEIRRKVRRAEAAGTTRLVLVPEPLAELETFIELHQKRWGDAGLFPPTPGGECSRRFFRELFRRFGPDGALRLTRLTVGERVIAEGVHFDDGEALYYYNAGMDPEARELSPGVVMGARYVELAIALGRRRLDFLRGNEPYKYEFGAVDVPIQRLLVTRNG